MKKEGMECKVDGDCNCSGKMIHKKYHHHGGGSHSDALYGVGVIGAIFYFLQGAVGFWPVVVGIVKAFFWPAFVVFKLLGILNI